MERKTSVVTPERFASGMTFDQYVAYVGTPENLKREGSGGRPRSDMSAPSGGLRRGAAGRGADRGGQVAGGAAERSGQGARHLGGMVVRLPPRRADARTPGRGGRHGAADLPARRAAVQREPSAEPRRGARQQRRHHGRVPQQQERQDVAVDPGRGLLHEEPRLPLPLHRVSGDLPQGRLVGEIRAARPGESKEETQKRGDREFAELQQSPFFRIWACAGATRS